MLQCNISDFLHLINAIFCFLFLIDLSYTTKVQNSDQFDGFYEN